MRNVFFLLLIFYFYFLLSHTLRCCPGEFWFIRPGRAADAHHTWMPVPWRCSMWALIVCILLMIFFWWPTKEIPKLITSLKQKHNVHKSQQWSMKRSRGISLPKQKETEKGHINYNTWVWVWVKEIWLKCSAMSVWYCEWELRAEITPINIMCFYRAWLCAGKIIARHSYSIVILATDSSEL